MTTEADNSGVPYASSFSVVTHICLMRVDDSATKLIVKAEVVFKNTELWGLVKDKIGILLTCTRISRIRT